MCAISLRSLEVPNRRSPATLLTCEALESSRRDGKDDGCTIASSCHRISGHLRFFGRHLTGLKKTRVCRQTGRGLRRLVAPQRSTLSSKARLCPQRFIRHLTGSADVYCSSYSGPEHCAETGRSENRLRPLVAQENATPQSVRRESCRFWHLAVKRRVIDVLRSRYRRMGHLWVSG